MPAAVELTLKGTSFAPCAIFTDVQDAREGLARRGRRGQRAAGAGRMPLDVAGCAVRPRSTALTVRFLEANVETVEESSLYPEHLLVGGELDVAVMVLPVNMYAPALQTELVEVSAYRWRLPLGRTARRARCESASASSTRTSPYVLLTVDQVAQTVEAAWRDLGIRPKVALKDQLGGGSARAGRLPAGTWPSCRIFTYRPWSLDGDKVEARLIAEELPPVEVAVAWRARSSFVDNVTRLRQHGDDAQSPAQKIEDATRAFFSLS